MNGIDLSLLQWSAYTLASILFILGIKRLSKIKTARQGNLLSSTGMLLAVLATLADGRIVSFHWILAGILIGAIVGGFLALRIRMTAMPQMVALLNGFGGLASLLVSSAEFYRNESVPALLFLPIWLSVVVGGVTFTGSMVAYGKLQGLVSQRSIRFPLQHGINLTIFVFLVFAGGITGLILTGSNSFHPSLILILATLDGWMILLIGAALLLGVLLVLPIGGADMPVVISLLNSYSGIAAATTGFVLLNSVLIITGALVGASGIILTNIMCRSMNRSLLNVLLGGFGQDSVYGGIGTEDGNQDMIIKEVHREEAAMLFDSASSVIVVPGYGMAVAQAQHAVRELTELLQSRGKQVRFAIHPVAGRMPGHMNVLLAEANIPYELLYEMERINDDFASTDIALVVGANDVTNPAARHVKGSPIYGMPVLNVDKAKTAIVIKRSMKPGYSGIENELYGYPSTLMYFGDAKEAIAGLIAEIKEI